MSTTRRFSQLDVFTTVPLRGNALAVVHDAEGLSDAEMAAFAKWTNLSETTFLLPPTDERADYRVRIFTPVCELPFAGHPTLGTCHAWLAAGGQPRDPQQVVQQCTAGLVPVRRDGTRLAFAAPPMRREPVDDALLAEAVAALGLPPGDLLAACWLDNGPKWLALRVASASRLRALQPDLSRLKPWVGLVAAQDAEGAADTQFEVRGFTPADAMGEDPVTGSLNASIAQWLLGEGLAPTRYVAAQGTSIGRAGRVHVERDSATGTLWIGGDVAACISGTLTL